MKSIYVIGSLRNKEVPIIANEIRSLGFEVFDDWHAAGPEADDEWKSYELKRGHHYGEALKGHAARHVFHFDLFHLDRCGAAVLALPAGRSGHLEFGYMVGQKKRGYVLFPGQPADEERWDVMYQFANGIYFNLDELKKGLLHDKPAQPQVKHEPWTCGEHTVKRLVLPNPFDSAYARMVLGRR